MEPEEVQELEHCPDKNIVHGNQFSICASDLDVMGVKKIAVVEIGNVDDATYGRANVKISTPLFTKFIQPNLEELPSIRQVLLDLLYDHGVIWGNDESKYIDLGIFHAAYSIPEEELNCPSMIAISALYTCGFYFDDLIDDGFITNSLSVSRSVTAAFSKLHRVILTATDTVASQELSSIPALQPIVYLMTYARDILQTSLPTLDFSTSPVMSSLNDVVVCQITLHEMSLNSPLGIQGYKFLRRYDVAVELMVELRAEIQGIHLKPDIRQSTLFKIIMDAYSTLIGYWNDMLGILKDIRKDAAWSLILRRFHKERIDLETAIYRHNEELVELLKDFVLLSNKLCSENPADEALKIYFQVCKEIYVQLFYICEQTENRYGGERKHVIVHDFDIDCSPEA